jgi:uncharacterized membrane protein
MAQALSTRNVSSFLTGPKNLSMTERTLSVIGGLGLAAAAVQPRPNKWLSLAALIAGSMLAMRGATGHCAVKAAMMAR